MNNKDLKYYQTLKYVEESILLSSTKDGLTLI